MGLDNKKEIIFIIYKKICDKIIIYKGETIMEILIMLVSAILFSVILGLILRKKAFKKNNHKIEEYLNKKEITIENELQKFIDTQRENAKIMTYNAEYIFNYKNNEYTCIIVKYKIEGNDDWLLGIVSDSGSYTDFTKFNINYLKEAYVLLQKIYKQQPLKEINEKGFTYLSKVENIYGFNIEDDEEVIFNSIVDQVTIDQKIPYTNTDICIGTKAKLTVTNKRIYIYGGGLWTIDIYNDISDYKKNNMSIEIELPGLFICREGLTICNCFKFYFKNIDNFKEFERVMDTIIV